MKQKTVIRGKRGKKPVSREAKKFDPIPARWWRAGGSKEKKNRDDERKGRDW